MGEVLNFTGKSKNFDRMEWLAEKIGDYGFDVSIIRNAQNWQGNLAFTPSERIPEYSSSILSIMQEMQTLWDNDAGLRYMMYEYYFSFGSLFYEASTSNALAFHEEDALSLGEGA